MQRADGARRRTYPNGRSSACLCENFIAIQQQGTQPMRPSAASAGKEPCSIDRLVGTRVSAWLVSPLLERLAWSPCQRSLAAQPIRSHCSPPQLHWGLPRCPGSHCRSARDTSRSKGTTQHRPARESASARNPSQKCDHPPAGRDCCLSAPPLLSPPVLPCRGSPEPSTAHPSRNFSDRLSTSVSDISVLPAWRSCLTLETHSTA